MRSMLMTLSVAIALAATAAHAGPYGDDFGQCLVKSTTRDDRIALVQWMFAAMSLHPAVSFGAVSEQQLDDANRRTAQLFTRLVTKSCRQEAQEAIQFEGLVTLQTGFQILGQVAGMELMGSPEVANAMSGLAKHLDEKALQSIVQVVQPE